MLCQFCVPAPPADWKPSHDSDSYVRWDFAVRVRDKKPTGTLACSLNPVWVGVAINHHCGQWRSGIEQTMTAQEYIWGTWETREVGYLRDEVKQLKAALKRARKRSTARLARLQGRTGQTPQTSG